jgi:hypothetical protein
MRRIISVLAVTALMAATMVAMAALAYADPVQAPNPGQENAVASENCVGYLSAAITGNGATIREEGQSGTRDDNIQSLQALCNNANQK